MKIYVSRCPTRTLTRFISLSAVDGGWSSWSLWSECNKTCGWGVHQRYRTCTNPPPSHGGAPCTGESLEIGSCVSSLCPVDGGWRAWSSWTQCSTTCGKVLRLCMSQIPPPLFYPSPLPSPATARDLSSRWPGI